MDTRDTFNEALAAYAFPLPVQANTDELTPCYDNCGRHVHPMDAVTIEQQGEDTKFFATKLCAAMWTERELRRLEIEATELRVLRRERGL